MIEIDKKTVKNKKGEERDFALEEPQAEVVRLRTWLL